ncbi:NADH-cytochrome b5 reductase [Citrus sinensis]|nr:NADH-cytochrome b5 reductase [Citrus sinensis]
MQMQVSQAAFFGLLVAVAAMIITIVVYLCSIKKSRGSLDPENFKEFKLTKRTPISHNTAKFRFALPKSTSILGLPVGQHILCRGKDSEGNEVIRPYTPITLDSDIGYFELVVKMYPKGRMSHHFREMHEGEYLPVKGPKLTRAILENPKDKTNVHLIYANVTVGDILLKDELDSFATNFPNRFKVYYVLSQPTEVWNGGIGHVSKEMIQMHCPTPAPDIQLLESPPEASSTLLGLLATNIENSRAFQQLYQLFNQLWDTCCNHLRNAVFICRFE